jgi:hypothetical protein
MHTPTQTKEQCENYGNGFSFHFFNLNKISEILALS